MDLDQKTKTQQFADIRAQSVKYEDFYIDSVINNSVAFNEMRFGRDNTPHENGLTATDIKYGRTDSERIKSADYIVETQKGALAKAVQEFDDQHFSDPRKQQIDMTLSEYKENIQERVKNLLKDRGVPNFDIKQRDGRIERSKIEAGANPFEAFNASSGVKAATKPDSFSSLNAKADHFKSVGLR